MEMMSPQLISKEMIKPSSPTPNHLKYYKLSFLDQIAPPNVYTRIILFFDEADEYDNHVERSHSLKKALAETLTHFYLLAGRPSEDSVVECNDEGAEYFEAKVPCKMSEVTKRCDAKELNQLLPHYIYVDFKKEALLAVQYNTFDCGKAAIGVCISHKIADGTSLVMFLNAFAAIARGDATSEIRFPSFDAASHFPPKNIPGFVSSTEFMDQKIVTKRFSFDKLSVDALKQAAASAEGSQVKHPTRVEAVSAFIWRRLVATYRLKSSQKRVSGLFAVNVRDRMVPPQPNSFGNLFWVGATSAESGTEKDCHHVLVSRIRKTIREIDADQVRKLQTISSNGLFDTSSMLSDGETEQVAFSGCCRFPYYEVDFGWGKPSWVTTPSRPYKNVVVLMGTPNGDGIEAWVSLLEDDMAAFERDPELVSLVS